MYNDSSIEMRDIMNLVNLLIILIFGTLPLCYHLLKEKKSYSKEESNKVGIITTLMALIISGISLYVSKTPIDIVSLIIASILNFIITKNLSTKNIEVKLYLKSVLTLTIFFLGSVSQLIPISLFHITEENLTPQVSTYLTCFSDVCIAIVLILMYYQDLKEGIKKAKENFNQFFDTNLKIWIFGFLGMMISNLVIRTLIPSAVAGNENAVQGMIDVSPFLMLLTAGVIAPIVEELTFRKAFQNVIKNKTIFVLTSGIIFGLLHVVFAYESLIDFVYVIPYASLGIAFAVMVEKSDNIISSIMMHFLHNSGIILLSIMAGMIVL